MGADLRLLYRWLEVKSRLVIVRVIAFAVIASTSCQTSVISNIIGPYCKASV